MYRTKKKLTQYWDRIISKQLPTHPSLGRVEAELKEHFSFIKWLSKRVVVPVIIFYIAMGLLFKTSIFGSLFISLLVFIYSNLLPDTDLLIQKTTDKNEESLWYERYFLLFFAPIIIYYVIAGRAKPLYSFSDRPFHNIKTALIYGAFLLVVGSIFWNETLKILMLPLFGVLGFLFHLLVDGSVKVIKIVK